MALIESIAKERSSYTIVLPPWVDAAGKTVLPKEITWTMTDLLGNVINGREDVSVVPDEEVVLVLDSDDLAIGELEQGKSYAFRIVSVAAMYTSLLGSDLWTRDEYRFRIAPLRNVT